MLSPFPKIKECTERGTKPHTRIQNWAACRAAGSPASCAMVDVANWDLTCSECKEVKDFALVSDNGDLSDAGIEWRGLLPLLTEPS